MHTGPVAVLFMHDHIDEDEPTCAHCYSPETRWDRAALIYRHADSKRTLELN